MFMKIARAGLVILTVATITSCDPPPVTSAIALGRTEQGGLVLFVDQCDDNFESLELGRGSDRMASPSLVITAVEGAAVPEGRLEISVPELSPEYEISRGDRQELEQILAGPFFAELTVEAGRIGSMAFRSSPEPGEVLYRVAGMDVEYEAMPLSDFREFNRCSDPEYLPTSSPDLG